jgi:hypothetical protein
MKKGKEAELITYVEGKFIVMEINDKRFYFKLDAEPNEQQLEELGNYLKEIGAV